MPLYSCRAADGTVEEFWFSMNEAPPIGKRFRRDRKTYTRIPDYGSVSAAPVKDRHFASRQLCRYDRDHAANGGKFDATGRPVFTSKRQVKEYCARTQGEHDSGGYDYE